MPPAVFATSIMETTTELAHHARMDVPIAPSKASVPSRSTREVFASLAMATAMVTAETVETAETAEAEVLSSLKMIRGALFAISDTVVIPRQRDAELVQKTA